MSQISHDLISAASFEKKKISHFLKMYTLLELCFTRLYLEVSSSYYRFLEINMCSCRGVIYKSIAIKTSLAY